MGMIMNPLKKQQLVGENQNGMFKKSLHFALDF